MADAIDDLFRRFGKVNKGDGRRDACDLRDRRFRMALNTGGSPTGRVLKGGGALRAHLAEKSTAHREVRFSDSIHRAGDKLFGTFRATGIDHAGKPFDRYGIDLAEVKDGRIALKDSAMKAEVISMSNDTVLLGDRPPRRGHRHAETPQGE